jgi:putative transposase
MPRAPRIDLGDYVYHVINRANARARIFHDDRDYRDFEYLLNEVREEYEMRILAYCVMPNHWHMLLYPRHDGSLGKAMHWLGTSHARRHHTRKGTIGGGHLYQGRYKAFLVEEDSHLLTVLKYIERNPVRAKLAKNAEDWKWGSAYRRIMGSVNQKTLLADPPIELPINYRDWLNTPESSEDLERVRVSVNKEVSFGSVLLPGNIRTHISDF